jgi:uncharacterized protein
MKHMLICAMWLLFAAAVVAADDKAPEPAAAARAILDNLIKEKYEDATKNFGEELKKGLPPDRLKNVWTDLLMHVGAFKKVHATNVEEEGPATVVTVTGEFEKGAIDFVAKIEDKHVISIFFQPNLKLAFQPPPYVQPDAIRDVEVKVNTGEWELPGTLTLPKGDGPFPAVVLVHNAGAQDRDETVGPNLPFRDLAEGLASKGVAVLRYEPRAKKYAYKLMKRNLAQTVQEDTVDDAIAALALLRRHKEIDPKQLYVLGYSLGGHLAPMIGQQDDKLAGLILLAAHSRPLPDVMIDEADYLTKLPDTTNAQKEELEQAKKQVERVKDTKLEEMALLSERIMGQPVSFWLSLRKYDAVATAAKLKMPMLILQGERDYQVPVMPDFEGWKKAMKGRDNVRFKSYPKLNHLLMEGRDKSQPREYFEPNHVSADIVEDIVEWIKKR